MKQKMVRHHFSTTPPMQVRANDGAERRVTKVIPDLFGKYFQFPSK